MLKNLKFPKMVASTDAQLSLFENIIYAYGGYHQKPVTEGTCSHRWECNPVVMKNTSILCAHSTYIFEYIANNNKICKTIQAYLRSSTSTFGCSGRKKGSFLGTELK